MSEGGREGEGEGGRREASREERGGQGIYSLEQRLNPLNNARIEKSKANRERKREGKKRERKEGL